MQEPVIARASWHTLLFAIGSLILTLSAGVFLVFAPPMKELVPYAPVYVGRRWERAAGVLAFIMAGIFALMLYHSVRYPVVVVDQAGIHRPPDLTIPWSDVYGVVCVEDEEGRALVLHVPRKETYIYRKEYVIKLDDISDEDYERVCRAAHQYETLPP